MKKLYGVMVAVLAMVLAAPAIAALDAGVQTVFTTASADFGTIIGYGWTLLLAIVGGLITMGLVKKVVHKAAG